MHYSVMKVCYNNTKEKFLLILDEAYEGFLTDADSNEDDDDFALYPLQSIC